MELLKRRVEIRELLTQIFTPKEIMIMAESNSSLQGLRAEIINQSRSFFEVSHSSKSFVPGETYIPASAKVMDGDDLAHLIDASLDMWLTAGRFSKEFEAK